MAPLTGAPAGSLAGFSAALVGPEPEGAGVSSSEKFFFNHLDGKHMVGLKSGEEGREGEGGKVEVGKSGEVVVLNGSWSIAHSFYISTWDAQEWYGGLVAQQKRGLEAIVQIWNH